MTKNQKTAIKAMLYAFDKYGANRLCGSIFIPNIKNDPEYTMSFGEAYNICQDMISEVKEETMETPQMNWNETLENLKAMAFGEQAFERFNAKERETLDAAINVYENAYAIETCNLELALENENLEEKLKKITDVLEAVYKCPACILDRNDALNKIMETYKEVRTTR